MVAQKHRLPGGPAKFYIEANTKEAKMSDKEVKEMLSEARELVSNHCGQIVRSDSGPPISLATCSATSLE